MKHGITANVILTAQVSRESQVKGAPLCGRFPNMAETNWPGMSDIASPENTSQLVWCSFHHPDWTPSMPIDAVGKLWYQQRPRVEPACVSPCCWAFRATDPKSGRVHECQTLELLSFLQASYQHSLGEAETSSMANTLLGRHEHTQPPHSSRGVSTSVELPWAHTGDCKKYKSLWGNLCTPKGTAPTTTCCFVEIACCDKQVEAGRQYHHHWLHRRKEKSTYFLRLLLHTFLWTGGQVALLKLDDIM